MKYTVQDGFLYYVEMFGSQDLRQQFSSQETVEFLETCSEHQAGYRYAPNKWSIKQIIGHITDHERIMTYRALRFSRKDTTLLPGYDQVLFVENSRFDELKLDQLLNDYKNVRRATNSFIDTLSEDQFRLKGIAWTYELSVKEFLEAILGHELHHIKTIKERYL